MKIVSIALSRKKGTRKTCVAEAELVENHGFKGDAHAGDWHRQVSFLAAESIDRSRDGGLDVTFGDYAENIATTGIDWKSEPLGNRFRLGDKVVVEITQIGKECHKKCAIFYQAGDCIMPKEGVFARVLTGGHVRVDDAIVRLAPLEAGLAPPATNGDANDQR
jgi:MOSC domain-containing protein YiiM